MRTTLLKTGDAVRTFDRLRPRDTDWCSYEAEDETEAWAALRELPLSRLLLVGAGSGPRLLRLVKAAAGYDTGAHALIDFLRSPFPPPGAVPPVGDRFLPGVRELALGRPGDAVEHGLFPAAVTRTARMALARQREYPADEVLAAARDAYTRGRPYGAHDALACAFVHPGITAAERADLMWRHTRPGRGWRSRRKTWRVLAWAMRHGYLEDRTRCGCGHDRIVVPDAYLMHRWDAGRLAEHWDRIEPTLSGLRCPACGGHWVQESYTSGHAEIHYGRPVGITPGGGRSR